LAKSAIPKIVPMLHVPDKDVRVASAEALLKIDPESYTNAMRASQIPQTNSPALPH
jgi:hypothetical protein